MTESTKDTVKAEAADVGRTAAEAGGQVAATAADEARHVAGEARRQAEDLVGQARGHLQSQAGSTQRQAADGVRGIADQLRQMAGSADGGPVGDLTHEAADRAERLASWLQDHEPGDLLEETRRLARRRPGAFLAGAALAGVLVGRLTRGVVQSQQQEPSAPGSHDERPADHRVAAAPPPAPTAVSPPPTQAVVPAPPPPAAAPPATPPTTPAHAPRPGATTVGDYVDELGRRGDPRVSDQELR